MLDFALFLVALLSQFGEFITCTPSQTTRRIMIDLNSFVVVDAPEDPHSSSSSGASENSFSFHYYCDNPPEECFSHDTATRGDCDERETKSCK